MNHLPTELVLMILKKADPLTVYKLKYQNRRISSIINKYVLLMEIEEIRVRNDICTAVLFDGREVIIFPEELLFDHLKKLAATIKAQAVVVDRVILNCVSTTDVFQTDDGNYFTSQNYGRILEEDFFRSCFPRVISVGSLEVNHNNFSNVQFLLNFLKEYRVQNFGLNLAKFEIIYDGFWKKLMNIEAINNRLRLSCERLKLDSNFLKYIHKHEVSFIRINALSIDFRCEQFLELIQNAIDKNLPINWSIFVSDSNSRNFVDKEELDEFLKKNNIGPNKRTESGECKQNTLVINLPNGRVQFPRKLPLVQNNIEKKRDLGEETVTILMAIAFVLLLLLVGYHIGKQNN